VETAGVSATLARQAGPAGPDEREKETDVSKTAWERTVELTIAIGERVLAPVERWIGRRSLVGEATFFPPERFPWVQLIEENSATIRAELERVLEDQAALPNFQDISKDQIEITDDDRWKTFFLYGYGFTAKLGVEMCPRTAALMRQIPGMTTAMFSILSPRKHILDHRGPYKGVLRYHLGLIVPRDKEACRIRVGDDFRHWEEGKSMIFDDTYNHEVWNDTDETRVVLFVDVLRPLPAPESAINSLIVKAIGYSPFVLDAKRNQEAWERRYLERKRAAQPAPEPAQAS
jgi:ornithine lipid ester-linked acyl 2-hydroxylase